MHLWHLTTDAPRSPHRVSPGDWVILDIGSWPVEPGQSVWVDVEVVHAERAAERVSGVKAIAEDLVVQPSGSVATMKTSSPSRRST